MSKYLTLATAFLFFFFLNRANAQTDTTHYDLGRIVLKKDFTQGITIKGSDLEHYQIMDLGQAISVWAYGTYTSPSNLIYVVDGNIITDPNTYSIYDIEEVTLVQNASALVSGADPSQQMVLIKTRTHRPGSQGIEAAAQLGMMDMRNVAKLPGYKSSQNLYDEFHLNGYKNFNGGTVGVSADYQHNVLPDLYDSQNSKIDAFNYNRIKLNAYAETKLWKGSTLNLTAGYTPQPGNYSDQGVIPINASGNSDTYIAGDHIASHLFSGSLNLNSHIVGGLTNRLSAGYSHSNYFEKDSTINNEASITYPTYVAGSYEHIYQQSLVFLIRDYLAYDQKLGDFDFQPALNFERRHVRDSDAFYSYNNAQPPSASSASTWGQYNLYTLTPSVDLSYNSIFDVQAGAVLILNSMKGASSAYTPNRVSPYVTATADITKMMDVNSFALRAYASFSRQNVMLEDSYPTLPAFDNTTTFITPSVTTLYSGQPYVPTSYNLYQDFNSYNLGLTLSLFKNFTAAYSFERRNFFTEQEVEVAVDGNLGETELALAIANTTSSRFSVNYIVRSNNFTWNTGLNATEAKLQIKSDGDTFNSGYLGSGHRWSGGFVNNFAIGSWFAGLDLLYQLGQRPYSVINYITYTNTSPSTAGNNSFSLQNLYIGKKFTIPGTKGAELYISTRNILQNKSSDITDERRFYGVGFKCGI